MEYSLAEDNRVVTVKVVSGDSTSGCFAVDSEAIRYPVIEWR